MPNKKVGTLVEGGRLAEVVRGMKAGSVEFRVNKHSMVMSKIGLREFETEKLYMNFDALMRKLWQLRPESLKGESG